MGRRPVSWRDDPLGAAGMNARHLATAAGGILPNPPDPDRQSSCHYCHRPIWPVSSSWGVLWLTACGKEWEANRHRPGVLDVCPDAPMRLHTPDVVVTRAQIRAELERTRRIELLGELIEEFPQHARAFLRSLMPP